MFITIQLIEQIEILHSYGIIHKDIKPDNFVLNFNNNSIKLIDFGLSDSYIENGKYKNKKLNQEVEH